MPKSANFSYASKYFKVLKTALFSYVLTSKCFIICQYYRQFEATLLQITNTLTFHLFHPRKFCISMNKNKVSYIETGRISHLLPQSDLEKCMHTRCY